MNNNLEEFNYINQLLDIYGNLLTLKQSDIMRSYYQLNLSLKEIADELYITRSAVLDTIEKSKKKLEDFEKKLGFYKKSMQIIDILEKNDVNEEVINQIIEELK